MLTIHRSTGNGLEILSRDAIGDILPRTDANLWLHFDAPTEEEIRFLQENFKIHHLTIEGVIRDEDLQYATVQDDGDMEIAGADVLRAVSTKPGQTCRRHPFR